jgi:transposase
MPRRPPPDPKRDALHEQGVLNGHPEAVSDRLFGEHEFFDARDLVQVKYEMLRRVETEGDSVSHAATAFGLSRPTFYEARDALRREGVVGLLPRKRGPRRAHKLTEAVLEVLEQRLAEDTALPSPALAEEVHKRFGIRVHPRSIERALKRREKKHL